MEQPFKKSFYNPADYFVGNYIPNQWQEYDRLELAHFAQSGKEVLQQLLKMFRYSVDFSKCKTTKDYYEKFQELAEVYDNSRNILLHWENLNKAIEQNPSLKDEWNTFLMVMKITEEDKKDE